MKIIIKDVNQNRFYINVESDKITVINLKNKIIEELKLELNKIKLIFNGIILLDEKTLEFYQIKDGSLLIYPSQIKPKVQKKEKKNVTFSSLLKEETLNLPKKSVSFSIPKKEEISLTKKESPKPKKIRNLDPKYQSQINELIELGYEKDMVEEAISLSNGNIELAMEYLMNANFKDLAIDYNEDENILNSKINDFIDKNNINNNKSNINENNINNNNKNNINNNKENNINEKNNNTDSSKINSSNNNININDNPFFNNINNLIQINNDNNSFINKNYNNNNNKGNKKKEKKKSHEKKNISKELKKYGILIKILTFKDPNKMNIILNNLKTNNESLLELIKKKKNDFIELLKKPITKDDMDYFKSHYQEAKNLLNPKESKEKEGKLEVLLTKEESDDLKKLQNLGNFNMEDIVEAYIINKKDVNLTANFLINQKEEESNNSIINDS